ncbi:Muramoyltetrapeptide carboxypeptidase LdcA (peptidoglycan recycling) [Paenibacillus sp. 1_12]|uniref:S66 family peptidase n=1 Tax=Paenibacillus sp. 1_12 TaxID=1566278 RepID=UPI0008F0B97F|nr:S66 peptidase family protein [Paenibacillus sp. 1_12]SFK67235.1 Muramoyltetrapeptide carboxypeptidase LdcA (peptidoglycan recycling) [Paenibacillus sp. 1_12]
MSASITYPKALVKGDLIAITAPSSGVSEHLHDLLKQAKCAVEEFGYSVVEGNTIWTQYKCVSASKELRALELQNFLLNKHVSAVIPPWGGEFLMEILPLMDWELLKATPPKWILGYSDISTFLFAYTLLTGCATAHGTNYIDLRSAGPGVISSRWVEVLGTGPNETVEQLSSDLYQSSWDFPKAGFKLDTPTAWKILGNEDDPAYEQLMAGRLIGGCLDTISILIGTPYAPLQAFSEQYCHETGMVWYLESCEMKAADLYRHLWQMKQCGWFENTNGVLIGRPAGYSPTQNFGLQDALHQVFDDRHIPVIYEVDIGHVPPQLTLVNGAFANVSSIAGRGSITMSYI